MADPRIAVIGYGAIGRTHIATWQALGYTPVAIADAQPVARKAAAEAGDWHVFERGEDLLDACEVDIISICTPPAFHRDLAIAALQQGKTVLCEKPLAATVADAEAIAAVTSGQMHVGFCHRFEPAIVEIKRMIDAGELGTPITLRNRFAGVMASPQDTWFANPVISGGGALADTTIHSIDLFRYLLGDATEVRSMTSTQASDLGPGLEVEDTGVIILRNQAGAIGVLEASWRTPPGEWSVTVYGTRGSVSFDYATGEGLVITADGERRALAFDSGDRFQAEFRHVVDCWCGEGTPRASVADGVAANRILAAAYADAIR